MRRCPKCDGLLARLRPEKTIVLWQCGCGYAEIVQKISATKGRG